MNVDGLLWGVSQSENRSETHRPGLPHATQTKHMLWGSSVACFWSKKLVDQDRTVCTCVFTGFTRCFLFVFSSPKPVEEFANHLKMSVTFLLLLTSQFESWNCSFLHTIETPQPPHTAADNLISPCRASCVTHSMNDAMSSVCFDVQVDLLMIPAASDWCSHCVAEVLLCLWPLFISACWLLGPHGFILTA